jgi:hypothetical protein
VVRDCVIRDASAGITFGSETSGGFHDIKVSGLTVHHPTPVGILFKSAHTRGGTISNIDISDMHLQDVPTVFRVNLNWNPSYSYAEIPAGMTDVPPYWTGDDPACAARAGSDAHCTTCGSARSVAVGAKTAFEVAAFAEAPLERLRVRATWISTSRRGGKIADAKDWRFTRCNIDTLDGKGPEVTESSGVVGL